MRRILRLSGLILFVAIVSGCSHVLNPYSSQFSCPHLENGKCVDIDEAHDESLAKTGVKNRDSRHTCGGKDCAGTVTRPGTAVNTANIYYQDELHKKIAGLLEQPVTPVVAPPTVMRILMLPYKGDENELYMYRYVYLVIDGPHWVMGDYLFKDKASK